MTKKELKKLEGLELIIRGEVEIINIQLEDMRERLHNLEEKEKGIKQPLRKIR